MFVDATSQFDIGRVIDGPHLASVALPVHPLAVAWGGDLPHQARMLAGEQLAANEPRRWRHVQSVARRAEEIAAVVGPDTDVLTGGGVAA